MRLRLFWRDERAQATTEYVLILAVITGIAVTVLKALKPILSQAREKIAKQIEDQMFRPGTMHEFRLKK